MAVLANGNTLVRTITVDGRTAGHIAHFMQSGAPSISYWLGRDYWGQGIATRAVGVFLVLVEARPLYARAAKDNAASLRVLTKIGFSIVGEDRAFAEARGCEVEEFILMLEGPPRSTG